MALSPEFERFYRNWLSKAAAYSSESISDYFDKYFTLFVLFNRLYAEATFLLARKNQIKISKRTSFPDSEAAKFYVSQYLKSSYMISELEEDTHVMAAIDTIIRIIDQEQFYIKLDLVTGDRRRNEDLKLLKDLQSTNSNDKASAILDLLYTIRCNMFHGHKGFEEVQVTLLRPATTILRKIIEILFDKLSRENS